MNNLKTTLILQNKTPAGVIFNIFFIVFFAACSSKNEQINEETRHPNIFPDYIGVTVPPNIAPLNFMITELEVKRLKMRCIPKHGSPITVNSKQTIRLPMKKWKKMLRENINETLSIEISAKINGQWTLLSGLANFQSSAMPMNKEFR